MTERVRPVVPPRVAVFTVTLDRLDYTCRMLSTIRRCTGVSFDHYVVDNGSTDGTVPFLQASAERFAGVRFNETNRGLDGATNQALEMIGSGYDFIVKVDNDCEFVDPGWLEALVEVAEESGRRIVVSPRTEGLGPPEYDGGHPRTGWELRSGHVLGLANHVGGLCLLAPSWMYDGFRYRKNTMHGNQDVLFSLHVRLKLKCEMGYVEDVRVHHMDTTNGQWARYPDYFAKRRDQQHRVYGESGLRTAVLTLPRRAVLRWRMGRAGLLEGGLGRYLGRRAAARAGMLRLTPGALRSMDGTGTPPMSGPRTPPEELMRAVQAQRHAERGRP